MLAQWKQFKRPLNRAIISDILLWVGLTLLLAYGVYLLAVVVPARRGQTIVLSFQNANEISKGSPIKMMGIDIGFVDDVQLKGDHVEVTLQTYPKALEIPSGSTFTILFTGLAGAKSIEVELPTSPQPNIHGKPFYRVEEPIRMADTLEASIKSTRALQQGAENITDFFGKKKPVEELQLNIQQTHRAAVGAIQHVEHLNQDIRDVHVEVRENSQSAITTLHDIQAGVHQVDLSTRPEVLRPKIDKTLQTVQDVSRLIRLQGTSTMQGASLQQRLVQINQDNSKLASRLQKAQVQVTQWPLASWIGAFSDGSDNVVQQLDQASRWFAQDHLPALQQARVSIQRFNQQLETLNVKIGPVNHTGKPATQPLGTP